MGARWVAAKIRIGWSSRVWCLLALACSGCFFYDSRWGQQKQAQQHEAAHLTPQTLRASSAASAGPSGDRALTLRVYATPGYAASVVDWQKQFNTLLFCANAIFSADFGAHFEVAEFRNFRPQSDEEKLDGVLGEITREDPAAGVDWVIVLARSVPRFAASADDLGLAPLVGQHLAMRAMSDAHEYEAIQSELTELSEDARRNLYHVRKSRKLCAVFLHEIAHTLGVPHERAESSLMNWRYRITAAGFSGEAADVVRASLRVRDGSSPLMNPYLAEQLSDALRAEDADWEPSSRDAELKHLASFTRAAAPQSAVTASSTPAPPASPSARVRGLSPEEQATYEQARAALAAGNAANARALAAPLIAKHDDLPDVQDLRCNIAMAIGGDPATLGTECAAFAPFGAQ